jgi:hypothetical protein
VSGLFAFQGRRALKQLWPSEDAYRAAADRLACDVPAIKAVAQVEAGRLGAWLPTGEPVILYERHLFHRLTGGRHSTLIAPGLAASIARLSLPAPGGYGPVSVQHAKLGAAAQVDREAALKACSWGLYQILGMNHVQAGYAQLQGFVNAMYRDVDHHLEAFTRFVAADPRLVRALRGHAWGQFAAIYNGPQHARHHYAERMAEAWRALSAGGNA